MRADVRARNRRRRLELIAAYGGRCTCCEEIRPEFLALDHVYNDGAEHRRQVGASMAWALRKEGYPQDGYRLLCHNCNLARAFYGRCPHEEAA